MTRNMEELILNELFKLSDKVDKMLTKEEFKKEMEKFATKEELRQLEDRIEKKFATKEDLKKLATKEDLKQYTTHEELKKALEEQAKDISEVFQNTFITIEKMNRQTEERILAITDRKIENLRREIVG